MAITTSPTSRSCGSVRDGERARGRIMSGPEIRQALQVAAREAQKAASRRDLAAAQSLHSALENFAASGTLPDRAWLAATIRDTAAWATHDADVSLLAALGALARAAGR